MKYYNGEFKALSIVCVALLVVTNTSTAFASSDNANTLDRSKILNIISESAKFLTGKRVVVKAESINKTNRVYVKEENKSADEKKSITGLNGREIAEIKDRISRSENLKTFGTLPAIPPTDNDALKKRFEGKEIIATNNTVSGGYSIIGESGAKAAAKAAAHDYSDQHSQKQKNETINELELASSIAIKINSKKSRSSMLSSYY